MKLNIGKKSPSTPSASKPAEKPQTGGKPAWMMTTVSERTQALAESRMQNKWTPELRLKDGESKTIRFLCEEPLAMFYAYRVRHKGHFRRYTQPPKGERDLFAEHGLRPALCAIYEVLDYEGYVSEKHNKRVRNVRRYLNVSGKYYEALEMIRSKRGDLREFDIDYSRRGDKQSTVYTFLPDLPKKLDRSLLGKPEDALAGKVAEYYAPPTEEEQRSIIANLTPDAED